MSKSDIKVMWGAVEKMRGTIVNAYAADRQDADTRLVAAAPEMLRAMRLIFSETNIDVAKLTREEALVLIGQLAKIARAAVAKATGR